MTPVKEFADLTALQGLPLVQVKEKHSFKKDGLGQVITVELENPTPNLAFQVELNVYKDGTDEVVLPIFWDDNYVTLLPGEKRKVQGFFVLEDLGGDGARTQAPRLEPQVRDDPDAPSATMFRSFGSSCQIRRCWLFAFGETAYNSSSPRFRAGFREAMFTASHNRRPSNRAIFLIAWLR